MGTAVNMKVENIIYDFIDTLYRLKLLSLNETHECVRISYFRYGENND